MTDIVVVDEITYKDVIDYEFSLVNGARLPLTVDAAAGDTVTETPTEFELHLAAKPNPIDPEIVMNEEDITVYKCNLVAKIIRKRKQRLPTAEELFNLQKTYHKLTGVVN